MAPPRWSADLARPVVVKGGPTLRTLRDVRAFILDQPAGTQERQSWQKAVELLLAAATDSTDVEAMTQQVELALFLEARLVLFPGNDAQFMIGSAPGERR